MRIFIVKLLLFFFTTQLFAQTNAELAKIDSLIKVGSCEVAVKLALNNVNILKQQQLQSISECFQNNEKYQDAIDFNKFIVNKLSNNPQQSALLTQSLINLGSIYIDIFDFKMAKLVLEQAARQTPKNTLDYCNIIIHSGITYEELGDYTEAQNKYERAISLLDSLGFSNHTLSIDALGNLSNIYYAQKKYNDCEKLDTKVVSIYKNQVGENHIDYIRSLNNLSVTYEIQKKYFEAIKCGLQAKNLYEKNRLTFRTSYAITLNNIANAYFGLKNYTKAELYYEKAIKIIEINLGVDNINYVHMNSNLLDIYRITKNAIKAQKCKAHIKLLTNNIEYNFKNLIESEKILLIERYKTIINIAKYFVSENKNSFEFLEEIFNLELLVKSISLQTTQLMRNGIATSRDSVLLIKFDEYLDKRHQLNKWTILPIKERPNEFKVVTEQTAQLEKELLEKSASFAETQSFWKTTWLDVKRQLLKDEAAIELVSFQDSSDVTNYAALVLTSTNPKPKWVKLGTQKQLDIIWGKSQKELTPQYQIENLYASPDLYRWFWQPLTKELNGIKNIYIAPVGGLHKINFGAIKVNSNQTVADLYSINRLLSTRELVRLKKEPRKLDENATLALFGDIDFDADSTNITNQQSLILQPKREANTLFVENRAPLGEVFPALFHTADEISMADSIWQNKQTKIFKQAEANEFNIKHLSVYKILHIATHGFFFETSSKASTNDSTQHKNILLSSENPLMRAGLAFAGANKVWKGGRPYNDMEDGILTAQEVSDLNLVGNELVVLSACETALGSVDNNEGVYGLQRAFKMAGSKYILMSLWKVSDFHTKEMMILFYSALKTGKTIEQAYHFMQTQMQKKYANPFYWASFILTR